MRRAALCFLAIASPAVLATLLVAHPVADLALAVLVALFPPALVLLAVGGRRLGGLGAALAGLALLQAVSLVAMLVLRDRVADGPWAGGLPLAAAIQVYGVVAGLALVVLAYGLTFDRHGLADEDLERLRAGAGGREGARGR